MSVTSSGVANAAIVRRDGSRQIRISLIVQAGLHARVERWLRMSTRQRCLRLHACHRSRATAPWVFYLDVPADTRGELLRRLRRLRLRPGIHQASWEFVPA